jgi:DNA-binding transcriptional ArsR family regulator
VRLLSDEITLLKEISRKLSQLIILFRMTNRKEIDEMKKEIKKDKVARSILELADGSLSVKSLREKISESTKVSEVTVRRRIYELVDKGALTVNRKGKENFYENSGLYD